MGMEMIWMVIHQNLETHKWLKSIFDKIESKPQTQESLDDQLVKLYSLANYFGLYDGADFIRNVLERK
jgi:hypothetical protein